MLRFVHPPPTPMAPSRSAARSTKSPGRPRPAPAAGPRWYVAVLRRLLSFARPRAAHEAIALLLTLLATGTVLALAISDLRRGRAPGGDLLWTGTIYFIALAARLTPWWRVELDRMTPDRARNGLASALLFLVALSAAGHLLLANLGITHTYPLLGPFDTMPAAGIILVVAAVLALALLLEVPVAQGTGIALVSAGHTLRSAFTSLRGLSERRVVQVAAVEAPEPFFHPVEVEDDGEQAPSPVVRPSRRSPGEEAVPPQPSPPAADAVPLPPIETFTPAVKAKGPAIDLDQVAQRIEETLASFNVRARVVDHHSGPVVTQFDVRPDPGVKVKSITALQNDLALALAAPTIRIQAPVPGRPVVGIEIPNSSAANVSLRELLESEAFTGMKSALTVVLGKDVAGKPAVIDLARMPHLLVAGATGSGKSVCINALISCLLYRNSPEEVRLLMIDPKMVELTVYNGVPHLLAPVVTQMDKVVGVLQWAIREMERRYQLFAGSTVRNISRYNEKMEAASLPRLPYIVIIVDELADLMMVSPEDVEEAICRLAQLARAAGIHLVIATQRPSVDVVTGLIKANFPARIAFAMTSQVDSRTILDRAGAEKLLGRGDMLYQPPDGPAPIRLQGAFLSDGEIERLVEFWHRSPLQQAIQRVAEEEFVAAEQAAADAGDELLDEATRIVREFQHASVTLLQRRLRIGYARAARLMDQLEERGIVGPADGSKQRPVLPEPGGDGDEDPGREH